MSTRHRLTVTIAALASVISLPLAAPASSAAPAAIASSAKTVSEQALKKAFAACPASHVCLWEHINFGGRMKKFQDSGLQSLRDYDFGDTASSVVNKSGRSFQLVNERRFRHDEYSQRLRTGGWWNDLRHLSKGKGNWNDEADKIFLR